MKEVKNLTSVPIRVDTLKKIREIAKKDGMKIYGVIDKLLENYLIEKFIQDYRVDENAK